MMTTVSCASCCGINAVPVSVEVNISSGIGIHLVGLADAAVKESLLRTMTALQTTGFRIPGKKIVINLAPADLHKRGSGYDLPIAIGIIAASGQKDLPGLGKYMIMGELGLDASVRDIQGALPIAGLAEEEQFEGCIFPAGSAAETMEYSSIRIYGVDSLEDVVRILEEQEDCSDLLIRNRGRLPDESPDRTVKGRPLPDDIMDFADIYGQDAAKRGLEIASAGSHNVLLIGSPGSGKSSLAKATSMILPPMTREESIETSKIYSVAGKGSLNSGLMHDRPFRAPHYSSSLASLIGGGSGQILPGEISLAHNGILFLDEFAEMPKKVSEALRGPIEDRKVTISRLRSKVEYPASFMLIAATNPCPCGYYGDGNRCTCTPGRRQAYLARLSGPLMDRLDLQLWLRPVEAGKIIERKKEECSASIAERIIRARDIQEQRFRQEGIHTNAEMSGRLTEKYCRLDDACKHFLEQAINRNGFSARACTRILKLARTIADLDGKEDILLSHLSEAVSYRLLDKKNLLV